jgi:hypothetical protein
MATKGAGFFRLSNVLCEVGVFVLLVYAFTPNRAIKTDAVK